MSTYTVSTSSELMENYLQADVLLPQDKFNALQTDTGASLLFCIGTGGVFNLVMESPGLTHGWRLADLSTAQIQRDLPGGTCKDFAVGQHAKTSTGPAEVHMVMVVNDGTNDHLYLSLGNSDSDTSWANAPAWRKCPFNAVDPTGASIAPPSPLSIAGVFVSEATDGEYIVVDLIESAAKQVLTRYYIATTNGNPVWTKNDLAVDIQASGYQSCLGRAGRAHVDGLYTNGSIGTPPQSQLIYAPLKSESKDKVPPPVNPVPLNLPDGVVADAIAACRNADNTSDLYVAAKGSLYYFASSSQHMDSSGNFPNAQFLVNSSLLTGVRSMFASSDGTTVTVWGLNHSDEVFYLTCPASQAATGSAWTVTVPILTGVDAISPYVDRNYGANTFFAHTGDGIIKLVKTPSTGLWSRRKVTLPPSDLTKAATPIHSYTTHVAVTDSGTGKPAANVNVELTTASVTSVYINHLYYVIGSQPVQVTTDVQGTVTIVETATSLAGTRFNVVVEGQDPVAVNPHDTAMQRNASYNTQESLTSAVITNRDGTTRPFVPAGTSGDVVKKIAQSNQGLASAYKSVTATPPASARRKPGTPSAAAVLQHYPNAVVQDIGDIFSWIESGVDAVVDVVEDAENAVWQFVAAIGDAVYSAVLDCVEAVVSAVTWLYNQIVSVIDDIIQFLQFLFGWQDILVTHNVMKNYLFLLAKYGIDELSTIQSKADSAMSDLATDIANWGGVSISITQTAAAASGSNTSSTQNSAPSNLGMHHFKGNCSNSSSTFSGTAPAQSIYQDLISALKDEETVFTDALDQIKSNIIDKIDTLGLDDIFRELIGILGETIVQSARTLIDKILAMLQQIVAGLIDVLTAPIDIPVLSSLYKDISGNDLTFLDLACLIAAIPATLVYKAAKDAAPFTKGDPLTDGVLNAQSFSDIQALFRPPQTKPTRRARAFAANAHLATTSPTNNLVIFNVVSGVMAFFGGLILSFTSLAQKAADDGDEDEGPTAKINAVANLLYVSPNFSSFGSDSKYAPLNDLLTVISILKGFSIANSASSDEITGAEDITAFMYAAIESVINFFWNIPVIGNLVEVINSDTATKADLASLAPFTVGNFCFNFGGMMELSLDKIKNDKPQLLQLAGTQALFMVLYGTLMLAGGIVYAAES